MNDHDEESFDTLYRAYVRLPGGTHDWRWNGIAKVPTRRSAEEKRERCALRVFNDSRDSIGRPSMTLDQARELAGELHA